MSLEHIGTVKALVARAPWTDHGSFVMGKSVPILIIASGETAGVELAADNRTFLRPLRLVSEYVGLDIFDGLPTLRKRAPNSVPVAVFPSIAVIRRLCCWTWFCGKGSIVGIVA